MESVDGISRPRRGAFRGAGAKLAPSGYLPVEYAPLRRKVRAVKFPSFTARFRESAAWEFFAEHWRRSEEFLW